MGSITKRLVITAVIAGLATATFAGVAGAGGELSKKEYLKEANATCKAGNKEIDAAFGEAFAGLDENDQPSPEQIDELVGLVVPIFRGVLDDIEALEGPSALDKKVDALTDEYRGVLDDIEADPQAVFGEDAPDPFKKLDKKTKKLGLKVCAQSD